jgi:K+-transporting ATPase c subunit
MKTLLSEIRPAIVSTLVLAVVCCGFYPLAVTGISKLAFAKQSNGSLIVDKNGVIIGSALIGQNFSGERYFHPRPSAAGANGYDAASSSGSNLGPTSRKLADQIKERVATYREINGLAKTRKSLRMRSPHPAAAWIPTSARPMRRCKAPASPRPACFLRKKSGNSSPQTPTRRTSVC